MSVEDRVLDGLGPGLAAQAGPLLAALVGAMTTGLAESDALVSGDIGWAPAFDLPNTPFPGWLGQLAGVSVAQGTVEQQRAAVSSRGPGRGTREAIITAAKSTLTGTQRVDLVERAGGDAYRLQVQVFQPQMASEAATRAAITAALPAGLRAKWELVVLTGQTWAQLRGSGRTWDQLRQSSFDAVRSEVPQ